MNAAALADRLKRGTAAGFPPREQPTSSISHLVESDVEFPTQVPPDESKKWPGVMWASFPEKPGYLGRN